MRAPAALYEELLHLPEHITGEIIDGKLYTWRSLPGIAAHAKTLLLCAIGASYDRHFVKSGNAWWLLWSMQTELGDEVFVPDIAGWRHERLPVIPTDYPRVAPDWVCEIVTSDTEQFDRSMKLPAYALHGVSYVWLVDPVQHIVETYALENARWVLLATYGGDEKFRAEPFTAVEIDLASIWGPTPSEGTSRS